MRLLHSVTVMVICCLTCSSNALPFIIPETNIRTVVNAALENVAEPTLNICDLVEIVKSASHLEFQSPHYDTEDVEKLKNAVEEWLANYLNGRQSRQAQVGYNINSFGLRFGKRGSKLKLDSV
ncbi:hypothetical protein GDO81_013826 [Engystomops pustulosus]|uniref:Secreted protein n=1 Tax=Engystomops pustulosus TaxID=76066 RepID=A0AAV7B5V7_ENGPU|nr:hypothetical protein GDO81_013826 [Engystomops pustulosus]KAG8567904.1 hypothetical protein GDO81_013826 [Engystomops pustulosus]